MTSVLNEHELDDHVRIEELEAQFDKTDFEVWAHKLYLSLSADRGHAHARGSERAR